MSNQTPQEPVVDGQTLHRHLMKVWDNWPGWGTLAAVNHTSIGLRFLITGLVCFVIGGVLAMLMRTQLALPEQSIVDVGTYNQLFTMHGTIMMFLFAIPALEGLAVYLIPMVLFFAGFGLGMALSWRPGLLGGLGFVLGVIYAVWFDRHTAKKNDTVYTITGYAPGQGHC